MTGQTDSERAGLIGLARKLIEYWALLGGLVLVALVLMSTWSVTSSAILGAPVPGDFEMVEVGVAIAAFSFLPYCQLTGANVSADIFTAKASRQTVAFLQALSAIIAFGFSLILLWRMNAGMSDYQEYLETTAILSFPIWMAFVPILISLGLLAIAAAITVGESLRHLAGAR